MGTLDPIRGCPFYPLLRHHDRPSFASERDRRLVKGIAPRLAGDPFSLSQYLIGIEYFEGRLGRLDLPSGTLLDLGCGSGNWSIAAARLRPRVVGIDARADRLRVARQASRLDGVEERLVLIRGDAARLPLATGSIDACVCANAFHYFPRPAAVARELRRVMRPGGKMYLSVARAGGFAWGLADILKSRGGVRPLLHWIMLAWRNGGCASPRRMREIASSTGWRVESWGPEGAIGPGPHERPLFPPSYGGLAFMDEHVWVAV